MSHFDTLISLLEKYLRQETQKSVVLENLQWIMPLILAVVAIVISLTIAHQQNRISLFEKRYDLYVEFGRIFSTIDISVDAESSKVFEPYFSELYENNGIELLTGVDKDSKKYREIKLKNYYKITVYFNYLLSYNMLFRNMKCIDQLKEIVEVLVFNANLFDGEEFEMEKKDVVRLQALFIMFFYDFKKMEKQLKL